MKARLILDLNDPDQKKELNRCLKAYDYISALDDILQEIFRPARKHGYNDRKLQSLLDGDNTKTEAFEGAVEDLQNYLAAVDEHGSEEQREYAKNLQLKLMYAEYENETSFSEGISLLEEKFHDILRDRSINLDDIY